eukprot:Em0018g48a
MAANVGTMRSQLQSRRAAISEEIWKENHMRTGSKKLAMLLSDQQSRKHVELEAKYSESKIQHLQAELSRINSNLQAYQSQSAVMTQVPLIPMAFKTTSKVSFTSAFSEVAQRHYHVDPASIHEAIQEFQDLRDSIVTVSKNSTGLDLLCNYYKQLNIVSKRFLDKRLKHGVAFPWFDAISGTLASQQSAIYEKAAVLFNVSSLYTQIAAQQDRSTREGLDVAICNLQKAIGCLEYMKDKFSHSPTKDMSSEMLNLFADLMKAQSHELSMWETEILAGLQTDIVSSIGYAEKTKRVSESYKAVCEQVDEVSMKGYLPACWVAIIKIKDAHFRGLSHYYAALVHLMLSDMFRQGGHISEAVRTEMHFMYTDTNKELFSEDVKDHNGFALSHLDSACIQSEYATKYDRLCKDLEPLKPLHQLLTVTDELNQIKRQEMANIESNAVCPSSIQPAAVDLNPPPPDFSTVRTHDGFKALGPLPSFSAENSWTVPRTVVLRKGKSGFGFSLKGSHPVSFFDIEEAGPAKASGLQRDDWLLSVNGQDTRYMNHAEVVTLVKCCKDEIKLEVASPTLSAVPKTA